MRLALLAALLALSPRAQAANAALHTCAVDESPWDADAADDAAPLPPLEAVDSPGADCARAGLAVSDWPAEPRTGVLEARRRLVDRHHAAAAPRSDEDLVFVMLNGENEGAPFTWVEGCDGTLAARAARALAPSRALPARRLHLLTVSARPVAGARDVAASGALLHLLFEGQTPEEAATAYCEANSLDADVVGPQLADILRQGAEKREAAIAEAAAAAEAAKEEASPEGEEEASETAEEASA